MKKNMKLYIISQRYFSTKFYSTIWLVVVYYVRMHPPGSSILFRIHSSSRGFVGEEEEQDTQQ
jgi:hypothetical protein